ncbi:hypothetical protein JCM15457_2326 [Liquorilactobacillus sucicola DSM 21376 = JCM 15457]|uniref:Uncharacterized protein n=1 Tax=Liquorilactobacillus sucicola DSM 21376 = JCM 15457 TaxID=1423806 RepID=A0A023D0I4_9LACO|nr:hypothetical protein [Liquorilactobacillus sucicola]KRN07210.1 hypothetical protein FD15_GL000034 [Liquorilactobacillus sucicola DSM 21376 = JCM 15457]GAJ27341.1 hypothetical protein JCM15457_2326 [Liquorilactobacillus sucicola DSM 21376 = JCM 15457]
MSENVLFNPGQAISSTFDFNEAYVAAQIYRKKNNKPLLVVQEKDGKLYCVFDKTTMQKSGTDSRPYRVIKHLD